MDQESKLSPQTESPDSLEYQPSAPPDTAYASTTNPEKTANSLVPHSPKSSKFHLPKSLNIYLLLFILLIVVVILAIAGYYFKNRNASSTKATATSQTLSAEALSELASSGTTVGDPKQVLTVASNAVFAGQVLMRSNLEIAGGLQVGGNISLAGLSAAGTSKFDEVQITKDLAVAGNTSLQGQLIVQKGISVTGNGTFTGTLSAAALNVTNLQLTGDLTLTRHIIAGGQTPTRANGQALGSGGTSSVAGSDTTGTLTINTGSIPAAGCFATITFASKFPNTPHVIVTPVGSDAANLAFYITRTASAFSVCANVPASSGVSFAFDYIVLN